MYVTLLILFILISILVLITGIVIFTTGMEDARRYDARRGLVIWGMALSAVTFIVSIIVIIVFVEYMS